MPEYKINVSDGDFDQLSDIIRQMPRKDKEALQKWLRAHMQECAFREFKVGDKVWFSTKKYGRVLGVIRSCNFKSISVEKTVSEDGRKTWSGWRVSPTSLYHQV